MVKYLILLFLPTLLLSQSYFEDDANTVLHINFNDEIVDTKSHTITPTGTFSYADGFKTGIRSLYFDGATNYLTITDAADLRFNQAPFTVALVIKFDRPADFLTNDVYICKRTGTVGWSLQIQAASDNILELYGDASANLSTATLGAMDGGLYYVLHTTFDPVVTDTITQYINGVTNNYVDDIAAVTGNAGTTGTNLTIGRFNTSTWFKGWIDEVIIWNDIRTPAEVLSDYNAVINYTPPSTDTQDKGFKEHNKFPKRPKFPTR